MKDSIIFHRCIQILFLFVSLNIEAKPEDVFFKTPPYFSKKNDRYIVNFELSKSTDVEIAIINKEGKIVRHLGAGMLGSNAPFPFLKNSLSQNLVWDGLDDDQQLLSGTSDFRLRIRAGMNVELVNILGGDPYAYFSKIMGQGDHAAWAITGMEVKSDGSVYLIGNVNNYGPAALRAYDASGRYRHTVYPPPSDKAFENIVGWGARELDDGSYIFKYDNINTPSPGTSLITGDRAFVASIVPSDNAESLLLLGSDFGVLPVNTDGTIREVPTGKHKLFSDPAAISGAFIDQSKAPVFFANSNDDKHFYMTGFFSLTKKNRAANTGSGFWREGRLYKVEKATGKATIFYSLEENTLPLDLKTRQKSPIRDSRTTRYSAFHGIAVDTQNRIFVCDRLNSRVLVLDSKGELIHEISAPFPDAISVDTESNALYITSRYGDFHKPGELRLLKFNDWRKDVSPSINILLLENIGKYRQPSFLSISKSANQTFIWVAYTELPVKIFTPTTSGLSLVRDFYQTAWQRVLDMQHMEVDKRTDEVYIHDGWGNCFKVGNWTAPHFEQCLVADNDSSNSVNTNKNKVLKKQQSRGSALGFAIDPHNDYYYLRAPFGEVKRFIRTENKFHPDSAQANGSTHIISPPLSNDWRIKMGYGERGMAVAPDGGIAVLGSSEKNQYKGPLTFYPGPEKPAGIPVLFSSFGQTPRSAGVRFDLKGNLYAGKLDEPMNDEIETEVGDILSQSTGNIYKYKPTGSLESGVLFPVDPERPEKIYDVDFGAIGPGFARTPFFDVDGYGRIYYPASILSRVSVIDNEGNNILQFGTWGNRDSMGRLKSGTMGSQKIPLAYPSSIGVTDNFIYVSDLVNIRLLKIKKTFELESTVELQNH